MEYLGGWWMATFLMSTTNNLVNFFGSNLGQLTLSLKLMGSTLNSTCVRHDNASAWWNFENTSLISMVSPVDACEKWLFFRQSFSKNLRHLASRWQELLCRTWTVLHLGLELTNPKNLFFFVFFVGGKKYVFFSPCFSPYGFLWKGLRPLVKWLVIGGEAKRWVKSRQNT